MAKTRKFRNRSFCMLEADLIESEAFLSLSGKAAMLVLIRFYQKAHRENRQSRKKGRAWARSIKNNGEIIFPYSEARELGIKSSRTFHKVIRELVEDKGFIDVAEAGNWYLKQATRFAISWRWERFGTPDYRTVKMPRILPEGLGFQKGLGPKPF
jgi:hypothetical protein